MVTEHHHPRDVLHRSSSLLGDLADSPIMIKSAKASDVLLLDLSSTKMMEDVSISVRRVGDHYTSNLRVCNLQCLSLGHKDILILVEEISSFHSWLSREPTKEHNHINILEC